MTESTAFLAAVLGALRDDARRRAAVRRSGSSSRWPRSGSRPRREASSACSSWRSSLGSTGGSAHARAARYAQSVRRALADARRHRCSERVAFLGAAARGAARRRPSRSARTGSSGRGYDPLGGREVDVYHARGPRALPRGRPVRRCPDRPLAAAVRAGERGREAATPRSRCRSSRSTSTVLLVAGAFSSLPYGYDRLHDRYLFYVVPLWLIVFVVWLADGLPRPLVAPRSASALALVLPAVLPFRQLANEAGIDTVPGALWVWVEAQMAGPGPASGSRVSSRCSSSRCCWRRSVPPAALGRALLPVAVLAVFVATSVLAWDRLIGAPEDAVFAGGLDRSWIDDRVPEDARVTKLYIESPRCGTRRSPATRSSSPSLQRHRRPRRVHRRLGSRRPPDRAGRRRRTERSLLESGDPLDAEYVFTQPGIELERRRVATGTNAESRPVATVGPFASTARARTTRCEPPTARDCGLAHAAAGSRSG